MFLHFSDELTSQFVIQEEVEPLIKVELRRRRRRHQGHREMSHDK